MTTDTAPPPTATEPQAATIDSPSAGEKAPADFMSDIIGDLSDMDAGKPPAPRDDKGKFKPAEKPNPKQPEKPKSKAPETPVKKPEEKATEPEPEKAPEVKPVKAAELRTAYEGLKKRVKEELEPEVQKLRSKVQEYESRKTDDPAPLVEKIKGLEEQNKKLQQQIEYADYTSSDDFKTKYHEPYRQAWDEAIAEFRELKVREPAGEDETGEPKYTFRPATESDLIKLGAMGLSDMDEAAVKMFGPSSVRAVNHIQNLRKLAAARNRALEEAPKRASEWRTKQSAEMQMKSQSLSKAWQEVNQSLQEKLPLAFKPDDTDDADKAAFNKGFALADLLFQDGKTLTPEQVESLPEAFKDTVKSKQSLSDEQRVQLHALARMQLGNNYRNLSKLKKATERIKELETELAAYEKSEPDAGKAGTAEGKVSSKDWLEEAGDELRALDR